MNELLIWLIIYSLGVVTAFVLTALFGDVKTSGVSGSEREAVVGMGVLLVGLFWPIVLLGVLSAYLFRGLGKIVFKIQPKEKEDGHNST